MNHFLRTRPLLLAVGAGLSLTAMNAGASPAFEATDLAQGYAVAKAGDDKKSAEHACGEGGCGGDMGAGDKADKVADPAHDAKTRTDEKSAQTEPAPKPAPKK